MTHVVEVAGVGFWSPGYGSPEALASRVPDPALLKPPTTLGSRRHMRFTSDVTRMAISVFEQATARAETAGLGIDMSKVNVFFASSQGEVQIAVELLEKVASEGMASPARFMNSVHNTVTGHISIATKSHGGFSALAGCEQTVSGALTECYAYLASGDADNVVLIAADEALPPPLNVDPYQGLAMALLLRRVREPDARGPIISGIARDPGVAAYDLGEAFSHLAGNPCAAMLGVLDALAGRREGRVRMDGPDGEGWCLDLRSPAEAA